MLKIRKKTVDEVESLNYWFRGLPIQNSWHVALEYNEPRGEPLGTDERVGSM